MRKWIFLLIISVSFIYGQNESDSVLQIFQLSPKLFLSKFNKQLNTYSYQTLFNYNISFDKLSLSLREDYKSTIVKSNDLSIRDDQRLNLSASYSLSSLFQPGIYVDNSIFSDSRKIEINSASVSNLLFFNKANISDLIYLSPYIGYQNNRQTGVSDYGIVYGFEGLTNNLNLFDTDLYSVIKFKQEEITPRKNGATNLLIRMKSYFENNINNSIMVSYFRLRRDFYFTADSISGKEFGIINNIQSRIENFYQVTDNLLYTDLIKNLNLSIAGGLTFRNIERDTRYKSLSINSSSIFDTEIDELKFDFETEAQYRYNRHSFSFKGIYTEKSEKHITIKIDGANPIFFEERERNEARKNNVSKLASLSFYTNLFLSDYDKLSISLSQYKLEYNTPDSLNPDDRDELLSIGKILYSRSITPFFDLYLSFEGSLSKLNYISSKRSANNYTNRILKFVSGGLINTPVIKSNSIFEVSANYTVYDFEDLKPNISSFVFRQFSISDSTTICFSKSIYFDFYGFLKLSEQGELLWSSFSMKPARYVKEILLTPTLRAIYKNLEFSCGMRYFTLVTYKYNKSEKEVEGDYYSIGPLSSIRYVFNDIEINFLGWFDFITQQNKIKYDYTNVSCDINWKF